MTLRRTFTRLLLLGSLLAAGLVAAAPPASADFHLMVISEVSDGTALDSNEDFVELQMFSPGQTQVMGHTITTYDASGNLQTTYTLDANVLNGQSQRTILIGSLGVQEDLTETMNIPSDGAVCFANVDCVAYGTITNFTNLTSPVTAAFPTAMPLDNSLQRRITAGCPTFLEASDDTNNSASDFFAAAPTPRNNSATPTETPCPGGPGGGSFSLSNLKTKVKGGRAIVSGKVQPPAPGQQVKLTFFANGSPLRKVSTKSATLNAASEFKKRFKVPADSTRCKVVVRFQGAKLGQKKFRC